MGIRVVALPIAGPPQVDSGPIIGQLWPGRMLILFNIAFLTVPQGKGSVHHCVLMSSVTLSSEEYPGCGVYLSELWRDGLYLCCAYKGHTGPVQLGSCWCFGTADLRDQSGRLQMARPTCSIGGCGSYLE